MEMTVIAFAVSSSGFQVSSFFQSQNQNQETSKKLTDSPLGARLRFRVPGFEWHSNRFLGGDGLIDGR